MRSWLQRIPRSLSLFAGAVVGGAILAAAGIAMGSGPNSPIPAPTPVVHDVPASKVAHAVLGSIVSAKQVEQQALQIAENPSFNGGSTTPPVFLGARLETVAAASSNVGRRVASYYIGTDRTVWMVWFRGAVADACSPGSQSCLESTEETYYFAFDAHTGTEYSFGVGAPSEAP